MMINTNIREISDLFRVKSDLMINPNIREISNL